MEPPKTIKIVSESEFNNTTFKTEKSELKQLQSEYNLLVYSVIIVCIIIIIYKFHY